MSDDSAGMRASEKSRWSRQSKNHAAEATMKTNQWYLVSWRHQGADEEEADIAAEDGCRGQTGQAKTKSGPGYSFSAASRFITAESFATFWRMIFPDLNFTVARAGIG